MGFLNPKEDTAQVSSNTLTTLTKCVYLCEVGVCFMCVCVCVESDRQGSIHILRGLEGHG